MVLPFPCWMRVPCGAVRPQINTLRNRVARNGKGFFFCLGQTASLSVHRLVLLAGYLSGHPSPLVCKQASGCEMNFLPRSRLFLNPDMLALTYMAESAARTLMIYRHSSSMRKSGRTWPCGKNKAAPFSYSDISCALGSFKATSPGHHCNELTCCVVLMPWETEFIIDHYGKQSTVVVSFSKSKGQVLPTLQTNGIFEDKTSQMYHKG